MTASEFGARIRREQCREGVRSSATLQAEFLSVVPSVDVGLPRDAAASSVRRRLLPRISDDEDVSDGFCGLRTGRKSRGGRPAPAAAAVGDVSA